MKVMIHLLTEKYERDLSFENFYLNDLASNVIKKSAVLRVSKEDYIKFI